MLANSSDMQLSQFPLRARARLGNMEVSPNTDSVCMNLEFALEANSSLNKGRSEASSLISPVRALPLTAVVLGRPAGGNRMSCPHCSPKSDVAVLDT